MADVQRTTAAQCDLDGIWEYIAEHDPVAADRVLDAIAALARLLGAQPGLGTRCDHLASGLRQMPVRRYEYVLFYSPIEEGIRLIRVLHGRRDIPTIFQEETGED